jgi:CMP-N-acetylneuraminic acid synthetase
MKIAGLVTIRLNSRRVPQKNIRTLGGKALCWYMVNSLLQVHEINDVYVYCSDPVIKDYIPKEAILLLRDKRLDADEIKVKDTYAAFIDEVDADIYVVGGSTSPFTKPETIRNGVRCVKNGMYDSAFTVKRAQTFAWYLGHPLNYDPADVPQTQEIKPVFIETSGLFVFKKELWTQHGRRVGFKPYMLEVENAEAIDIDTPGDFEFAQLVVNAAPMGSQ